MNESEKSSRKLTALLAFVGAMKQDLWFSGDSEVVLEVTWSEFEDAESGMKTYAWSIATSPCGNQLGAAHATSLELSFKHKLALKDGMPYFVCVYGFNHAGAFSLLVSASLSYDASPPHAGLVAFGAPGESDITTLTGGHAPRFITEGKLCVFWIGFADADSGIRFFNVSVHSGEDVTSPTVVSDRISVSGGEDDKDEFQTVYRRCWEETIWRNNWPRKDLVYARVFATNAVGMLSTSVISNALALEATGSVACSKLNITSVTQVAGSTTHVARVEWSPCTAASGIKAYYIGYAQAGTDASAVNEWKHAFLRVTQSLEMQLRAKTKKVTIFLNATSTAGNINVISRTVQMETQPPAVQYEVGCNSTKLKDHRVQKTASRACVSWKSFDKKLKQVRFMIGSFPGGQEIHAGVQAGSHGKINYDAPALDHDGATYYVTLQLTDASGNVITVSCGKVVIDTSPPVITRVATTREPIGDVLLLPSKETDACFQVDVVEAHSDGYRISIEIRDGARLLSMLTSINSPKICLGTDNELVSGKTYAITVVATNQADVDSEPMKLRFLLDSMPPHGGWIKIAPVFREVSHDPDRRVSGELSLKPPTLDARFDQFQSGTRSLVLWLNPFTAASGMIDSEYAVAVVPLNPGEFNIDMNTALAEAEKIVLEDLPRSKVWSQFKNVTNFLSTKKSRADIAWCCASVTP